MLQGILQGFRDFGIILAYFAAGITLLKLYLDYFVGSDVKLLETKGFGSTVALKLVENIGYFTEHVLPLVFANEGNKTGIVTRIFLDNKIPEGVAEEDMELLTPKKLPVIVKARDSAPFIIAMKWWLTPDKAKECKEGKTIFETTKKLDWTRTVHYGLLKNKTKLDFHSTEIKILVRVDPTFRERD